MTTASESPNVQGVQLRRTDENVREDLHSLPTLMALTGGIVVAVAFFDVLPESIEAVDDPQRVTLLVGIGFIGFFIAERILVLHHRDDAEHARASSSR